MFRQPTHSQGAAMPGFRPCTVPQPARILAAFPACLSCVVLMLGCAGEPRGNGVEESSITILFSADERVFGPFWSVEAWFLMFLPLAKFDAEGQIVPRLARSWEHTSDSRRWTFHLRSDVYWHDGRPTTAHDVKFSIELAAHPDILFDDAWHDVDSITVHDDTTLTIHYDRPKDARNTWIVFWPKHLLEDLDPQKFWEWQFWVQPVGNGPYRYVRHVPKTMVELRANADFYDGKPAIDRLTIKFAGGATGIAELLSGQVDILTGLNPGDIPKLATDSRFRVYHHVDPNLPWFTTIMWNQRHSALGDVRVRRALTMAIDRRELSKILNLPPELSITDAPYPSGHRRSRGPEPLPYDPARARALLAEAGWLREDSSTVGVAAGGQLRIEALVAAGGVSERVAVIIQANLRLVGVDMQIRAMDGMLVRRRVQSGHFEMAFLNLWNAVDGYLPWLSADGPLGYRNAEVIRLLRAAQRTVEPTELDRIYGQYAALVQRDLPITFLFPMVQTYAVDRRIRGLQGPYQADPMQFSERLFLEQEGQE